ncbi:MAG: alkene reductase [Gammaproteobacteria bacterium]|nr:alkene reductase [Gammaproteobacteria bacterium]
MINTAKSNDNVSILDPVVIGDLQLANRIAMAPMTRNRADTDNVPTPMMVEYYRQRASAGLIITEGTPVSPQGIGYPAVPGMYNQSQVEAWKKIIKAVHEKDGKIFPQLWHVGRISHSSLQPDNKLPVAPSAIAAQGEAVTYEGMKTFEVPHALTVDEIQSIVKDFAHAASLAKEAGFDGVELHAANGYLIDQFLRDATNKRTDEYGGSLENRTRFLLEVINAVAQVWPENRIGVRLSPINEFNSMADSEPDSLFNYVVSQLNKYALAYLHVVEVDMTCSNKTGFNFKKLRENYHGLYMANGGYTHERAEQAIRSEQADLVSIGIPYIANPDLVERFANSAELNEADQSTFYGGNEQGYLDYPLMDADQ